MPAIVIRPTLFALASANHKLPSGPVVIPTKLTLAGTENSVITPAGVTFPIRLPAISVNHTLLSGPAAMSCGEPLPEGTGYSVTVTWAEALLIASSNNPNVQKWKFTFVADRLQNCVKMPFGRN